MTYVAGIDSGGTHTNIRIVTPSGEMDNVELDSALSSSRSVEELEDTADRILTELRSRVGDSDLSAWISSAGYASTTRQIFEDILGTKTHVLNGHLAICNDAATLLMAHEPETVVIIAGTGSVVMARTTKGEVVKRGGDEWVASDYGSAFWLGLSGIRAAYRAFEKVSAETALCHHLIRHYRPFENPKTREQQRAVIADIARSLAGLGTETKRQVAAFAVSVTGEAEKGDAVARGIIAEATEELGGAAAKVYRELAIKQPGRVVQPRFLVTGSVAHHSRVYLDALVASLEKNLSEVRAKLGAPFEVRTSLNGVDEAVTLAQMLAGGAAPSRLDAQHPYSVLA
jgi:N-acetylglucosamine kinase-like BadF-type ATPase